MWTRRKFLKNVLRGSLFAGLFTAFPSIGLSAVRNDENKEIEVVQPMIPFSKEEFITAYNAEVEFSDEDLKKLRDAGHGDMLLPGDLVTIKGFNNKFVVKSKT